MWIALTLIALLVLFYLWCLMGRRSHPDMAKFRGWNYAHRGLHNDQKPENSLAAFQAAVDAGYGAELDVHLLKDGTLAVIHDYELQRIAGRAGKVEDLTREELSQIQLCSTDQTIPILEEVLLVFSGKTPLIVELKCADGNHAALCQATCALLDGYEGLYCMESFDPRAVNWLRKHRPDIVRGQLSENWMGKKLLIPGILKWMLTYHLMNVYTRPDFTAYKFEDRKAFGTDIVRKILGVPGVSWTLKTRQQYDIAVKEGWIPIFEGFEP